MTADTDALRLMPEHATDAALSLAPVLRSRGRKNSLHDIKRAANLLELLALDVSRHDAAPAVQPAAGVVTSVDEDGKWREGSDEPPLPCPWCGTTHLLTVEPLPENGFLVVKCRKCGASGRSRLASRAIEAQALWNDRAALAHPPAQASGEPVTWQVLHSGTWREILHPCDPEYWRGRGFDVRPLYAHPPAQASESGGEDLRAAGWLVAVHNDYRLNGEPHTFWLWTHPDGRWIKGEGRTDADALAQCRAALSAPQAAPGEGEQS